MNENSNKRSKSMKWHKISVSKFKIRALVSFENLHSCKCDRTVWKKNVGPQMKISHDKEQ